MNQVDPKWYFLCILVLIFGAITLPRVLDFPAYSQGDAYELCSGVFSEYESLTSANAPEAEWQLFEQRVLSNLDSFVQDYEGHPKSTSTVSFHLHQIARYNLPAAIQRRGQIPEEEVTKIVKALAQAHMAMHAPPPAPKVRNVKPDSQESWDAIVVTIIVGDILIAVGGGAFWFWRT